MSHYSFYAEIFFVKIFYFVFCRFFLVFTIKSFYFVGRLQGQRTNVKEWVDE